MFDPATLSTRLADFSHGELIRAFWAAVAISVVVPRIPKGPKGTA